MLVVEATTRTCYLAKTARAQRGHRHAGFVAYVRRESPSGADADADACKAAPPDGFEPALCNTALRIPRGALLDTVAESLFGCAQLCLSRESCAMFAYRAHSARCWLSSTMETTGRAHSVAFVRTGAAAGVPPPPPQCLPAEPAPASGYTPECGARHKHRPHVLALHRGETLRGCATLCDADPLCVAFTLQASTKTRQGRGPSRCWLADERDGKPADAGFVIYRKPAADGATDAGAPPAALAQPDGDDDPAQVPSPAQAAAAAGCAAMCSRVRACLAADTTPGSRTPCHKTGEMPPQCLPAAGGNVAYLCDTGHRAWVDAHLFPGTATDEAALRACEGKCMDCDRTCEGYPAHSGGPDTCEEHHCGL